MVVLTKPSLEQVSLPTPHKPRSCFSGIPVIGMLESGAEALLVKVCEEFGLFKVTNHGVPMELVARLEEEAVKFFSLPQMEKERSGPANPFGYGNRKIGGNGEVGWLEYLLLEVTSKSISHSSLAFLKETCLRSF